MRILRSQYLQSKQSGACTNVTQVANNQKVINTEPAECVPIAGRRLSALNTCRCPLKSQILSHTTAAQFTHRRNSTGSFSTYLVPAPQEQPSSAVDCYETTTYVNHRSLRISLGNIPKNIKLKVYIKAVDMGNRWLSSMYQKYENDLWHKTPRNPEIRHMRWYYHCRLCRRPLAAFKTLKYHLNGHLDLYPYVCKICGNSYKDRTAAVRHLKKVHSISQNFKPFIGI